MKDLKYIDDLAKSKLGNVQSTPTVSWEQFAGKMSAQTGIQASTSFFSVLSAKIIIGGMIIAGIIGGIFLLNNNDKQPVSKKQTPNKKVVVEKTTIPDTISEISKDTNIDTIKNNNKEENIESNTENIKPIKSESTSDVTIEIVQKLIITPEHDTIIKLDTIYK